MESSKSEINRKFTPQNIKKTKLRINRFKSKSDSRASNAMEERMKKLPRMKHGLNETRGIL